MPNPTIELSNIDRVMKNIIRLTGFINPNDAATFAPGAPFVYTDVRNLALQSDFEIRVLMAKSLNHPLRSSLNFTDTDELQHGDDVPFFFGEHDTVHVLNGDEVKLGELAQHMEHLRNHLDRSAIFGEKPFLYFINNGRIYFGKENSTAIMRVPNLSINRTANSNQGSISSPVIYEFAVVANTMKFLYLHGRDPQNLQFYTALAAEYFADIEGGKMSLRIPEIFTRLSE